ncbi:hypothetical protein [Streptomyces sp. NRRL F-5123]|uniref:hypothetical protein n=1 Tax=Streptomyces sp. NRRL F-5123 TaxID=1463856 RepID=UPI000693A110|nr:hypothetical protein [Streptomyces sp. NRRL F-5123]
MNGEHGHEGVDERPGGGTHGRRRLLIAVAVAAVLAAGTGGAYLTVTAKGGGDTVHPVAPIMRTPYTGPGPAVTLPAPVLPSDSGSYRLTGALPDDVPGPTPLYRPAAAGPDRAAVTRLASALGLAGPVVDGGGFWRVGAPDGTGPALLVGKDAPGVWSYARNGQVGPGQRTAAPPARNDDGSYRATAVAPGTVVVSPADGGPVGEQQARAAAAPVLGVLGLSGAEVDASRTAGTSRTVTADPVVDGLPTSGWETSVAVAQDGVISNAHGHLAQLAAGERKSVVGARRAFEELPKRRMMHPGDMGCRSAAVADAGASATAPPTKPCAAPPTAPVDVSGARFGLSPQFLPGGGQALVPSWLFTATPEGSHTSYVVAQPAVG